MIKTLKYINKDTGDTLLFDNYTIDKSGNICNERRKRPRKWLYNEKGYAYVQLRDEYGNMHKLFVARAILSTFCYEEYFDGANAGFKDENINNVTLFNLQWLGDVELANKGTRLERIAETKERNNSYKKMVETARANNSYEAIVEKNKKNHQIDSLLEANRKRQRKVLMFDKTNRLIKEFSKIRDVKKDGFDPSNVSKCCRNHCAHKGYYFEYA